MTIDRITKYGEITPDSRKLDDEEILHQPIVYNRDTGKYVPLGDANPMIQTILDRAHGSIGLLAAPSGPLNIRKNSSEVTRSDSNLSRQKPRDDDGENDSSTSSDTSSQTMGTSILSDHGNQSSTSSEPTNKTRKHHWSKIAAMNFFRRKKKAVDEPQPSNSVDDEDDEGEKALINDGLYGELKYKTSRHFKETPQFDKSLILQTIVDAHAGPIWCMK